MMRARKRITQIQLCFLSGVAFSYLQAAELGKRALAPDEESKVRICLDWPEDSDDLVEQFVEIGYEK
jgi:transcriptional regulator with XRE-family HTH domain